MKGLEAWSVGEINSFYWMSFASELHIPPWDLGRLTYEQLVQGAQQFDQMAKETAELKSKGR